MNLGKIVDKVYISEVNSNQDTKVVARCSVCSDKIEGKIEDKTIFSSIIKLKA